MSRPASPDTTPQHARGQVFRRLHDRSGAFLIPNPWDIGSTRLLEHLGFEALATTSAGHAASAGHPDGHTGRAATMRHIAAIASATSLPVSADLENGFADSPEAVAATIVESAAHGAVGGSIEDRGDGAGGGALYDLGLAVERITAAATAARALPFPYVLTARCECFLAGVPDIGETIRRLQAYQDAGADVLYAPGLRNRHDIEAVTSSVDRPVNVVMGLVGEPFTLDQLDAMGVTRVSLGSTLARVAFGAFMRAAEELRTHGTFGFVEDAMPFSTLNDLLARA